MVRSAKFALTGIFALATINSVGAQAKTQPDLPGQTPPNQQPQTQPSPQAPTQPGTNAVGQTGQNAVGQKGGFYGANGQVSQTPWYGNPAIRQHLNLNADQYNQLNTAYGKAWNEYQHGINSIGNNQNLTPQERTRQNQTLRQNFDKNFSTSIDSSLTDPKQRERYNQMYRQFQGYGAFDDPAVRQKLNLTTEQQQKLNQYRQGWSKQMNDLGQGFQSDQVGNTKRFNDLQKQTGEQINSVLNPQQRQTWSQMIGQPYDFSPNAYYQNNSGSNTVPSSGKVGEKR